MMPKPAMPVGMRASKTTPMLLHTKLYVTVIAANFDLVRPRCEQQRNRGEASGRFLAGRTLGEKKRVHRGATQIGCGRWHGQTTPCALGKHIQA